MGNVDATQWVLLAIAALQAVQAFFAYKARQDIKEVKDATNGMKDALVRSTAKEQFAAGQEKQRVEGELKAAAVAEGRLQGAVPGPAPASYTPDVPSAKVAADVIPVAAGDELVIRAADAKVETDKTGEGDLIIKASEAKVESKGKGDK